MDRYKLLDFIHLGFVPDDDFYLKIYKYDLSYPGFRDLALNELNRIGCHDAWERYAEIATEYEYHQYVKLHKDKRGA